MDTYELLWKLWCEKVPKKYVAKELLKVGKPMDIYFAKEKLHTTKAQIVFMSKRCYDVIANDEDDKYFEEYEEDDYFFKDLIAGCLGFKSLSKYDEATYPMKQGLEALDFLANLGINLIEIDKINPYGDFDDEDEDF